mgnify:FL=1
MSSDSLLIFGPPGCGKTHTLIESVKEALANGTPPDRIAFVAFTKKAIAEATARACTAFNLTAEDLPYFRTLHSMAFRGLGLQSKDMMDRSDWKILGEQLGMIFEGSENVSPDDGMILPLAVGNGDKIIQLTTRARYRKLPYEVEYNENANYSMSYEMMVKTMVALDRYKTELFKFDFVDLIERYITDIEPPALDLLIVDEAQDLTPLQWEMVQKLTLNAQKVLYAGDDDQAIHRWTGVDVKLFLTCSDEKHILTQSYRLPEAVHSLSQQVVHRIQQRQPKDFLATRERGSASFHRSIDSLDLSQGSWTLMTRTNSMAREWAEHVRSMGILYSIKGRSSVSQSVGEVITTWRSLQRGEKIGVASVIKLYENVPKMGDFQVVKRGSGKLLQAISPDSFLSYEDLLEYGMVAPKDRDPMDVARLGTDDRLYFESIERRGEDILDAPRVKLSTFHAMKGGEDDNCVVSLASTRACTENKHQDDEHRAFYVGITRTKKNLHIIESDKKYRYPL